MPPAKNGNTEKNPTVDLPISVDKILYSVDAVILTHLHPDHWDLSAAELINKEIPIFVQNEVDKDFILNQGFENVFVLTNDTIFKDVSLTKTKGNHGRNPEIIEKSGEVCGVILKHPDEKTLYLAGDTVWYDDVKQTLTDFQPQVIVVNAGGNAFAEGGALVMESEDVQMVAKELPNSTIVAVHMEATNHNNLSRKDLRDFSTKHQFNEQLTIPQDGESLTF